MRGRWYNDAHIRRRLKTSSRHHFNLQCNQHWKTFCILPYIHLCSGNFSSYYNNLLFLRYKYKTVQYTEMVTLEFSAQAIASVSLNDMEGILFDSFYGQEARTASLKRSSLNSKSSSCLVSVPMSS